MVKLDPSVAKEIKNIKDVKIDPATASRMKQDLNIKQSLDRIGHTVAIMSGKGGVGKSTVTWNLAVAFASKGYRVGLIDADITGPSIPLMAGIAGTDLVIDQERRKMIPSEVLGVKIISMDLLLKANAPVIWRGPLKIAAIKQFLADVSWGELDVLFIDLPPGTSDEPLSVAQTFEDIDGTIIVTTPQLVSVHDVVKSIGFASKVGMPVLGLVENMSGLTCPHCGKDIPVFSRGGGKSAADQLGIVYLGEVPLDVKVVEQGDKGIASILQDGEFAPAFNQVVDKLDKMLEIKK